MYELAIRDATLVTPRGRRRANVYVQGERIAAVTADRLDADRQIDASGLFLLPGMVDGHVHFQDPGDTSREDFITGSSAAAVGGVTTVIEHTHGHPVRSVGLLTEKIEHLRRRSLIDFGLAAHAWPEEVHHCAALWRAGVTFFKVFTCTTHGVPGHDAAHLLRLFRELARLDALCLVHCEDETMTADNERALRAAGRIDPGVIPEWRSREAELTALNTMAFLARISGVRAIAAHVSQPGSVELLDRERKLGARLLLETCPQYLYLYEHEVLDWAGLRKFTPPARIRSASDQNDMWRYVANGPISHISADHAPATRAQKVEGSIWDVHFGLPGVETTLTLLLSAVAEGRLALERVVELVAESPARLYGLFPRKGSLEVGSDADMVLVDLGAERVLEDVRIVSRAGWTPYAGRRVTGRVVKTFCRGRLVAEDGRPVAEPGYGRFLAGPGARDLAETTPLAVAP
ncbi:MAG: dihydroorotase family protein [Chloroflexi bacterium]|nr:dihydroorotase family protein [Chloroflexota bacterium]MBV9543006.1 dihydroorotase family protein [Chloroflexota bacterium]